MKENNSNSNKFTMGEDKCAPLSPPSITTTTTTTTTNVQPSHKKHIRHHVKRRSSGRVHVAKLAPMIRANAQTDPETDQEDQQQCKPAIRRSQSQRSLHRASFDRKGMTGFTQRRKSTASERLVISPPSTPPIQENITESPAKSSTRSTASSMNPAHLTHQAIAAPVEQTLTAVANNLIIPDKAAYPLMATPPLKSITTTTTTTESRKQPLRSQFVSSSFDDISYPTTTTNGDNKRNDINRPTMHRTNTLSRTQQKLMLQRQQAQVEDETSPIHPRNMQKLNKELELIGKEYRCVRRYQDPMKESLVRCLERKKTRPELSAHSMSTFVVPTFQQQQQMEKAAYKHHHLKTIALRTQNTASPASNTTTFPWNATAFLERMFTSNNTGNMNNSMSASSSTS